MSALTVQWVAKRERIEAMPWWSVLVVPPQEPEDLGPAVLRLSEQAAELELIANRRVWEAARDWVKVLQAAMTGERELTQEEARSHREAFLKAAQADLGIPKERRIR